MIKKIVLEILEYLRFQVENDKCTAAELRSIHDTLMSSVCVDSTIKDIAEHYGQSESNVRNAIARGYAGNPKRRVFYNFMQFVRCKPKNWTRNTKHADNQQIPPD